MVNTDKDRTHDVSLTVSIEKISRKMGDIEKKVGFEVWQVKEGVDQTYWCHASWGRESPLAFHFPN